MRSATPAQARQTREQFANPEDYLSFELGKAVQELPPLYTRLLASSISLLVFGAIAWANFSVVDEVATAPGQVLPASEVRPVRSLGGGSIKNVLVKEGDRVQKDQVIVERDPDLPQAEVDRLENSIKLIRQDIQRLEAERIGGTSAGTNIQDQLLASRFRDFENRQAGAIAETQRQQAVIQEAQVRLTRLQENLLNAKTNQINAQTNLENIQSLLPKAQTNLKLAQEREKSLRILVAPENQAIPRIDYLEAQERLVRAQAEVTRARDEITNARNKVTEARDKVSSLQQDIAGQVQQIRQAEQSYKGAQNASLRLSSERKSEILTQLNKRREELTALEGQLNQAKKQRQVETITSPETGIVYSIKATKGPVQPGEELLSILPDGQELLLEVKVLNRDIGFIRPGMRAKVKMATFPFQEFGTIDGTVVKISPNAIADKDLGLVFPTRISLKKHAIQVRGRDVTLAPGMAATGEIVTRQKSILTYLLEPITRRFSEASSVR